MIGLSDRQLAILWRQLPKTRRKPIRQANRRRLTVGGMTLIPDEPGAVQPSNPGPCPHCGGKLEFKGTIESPITGSPVDFFQCKDCGRVQTVDC